MKSFFTLALIAMSFNSFGQQPAIQYFRPYDKAGLLVFESDKTDSSVYEGLKVRIGGNFTHVNQEYKNFPNTDIRSGGRFKGVMIEGSIAF